MKVIATSCAHLSGFEVFFITCPVLQFSSSLISLKLPRFPASVKIFALGDY